MALVARPRRLALDDRVGADVLGDQRDRLVQRDRATAAEVIDAADRSALKRTDRAVDRVVDVRVRPRLLAIPEDRDRPTVEHRLGEEVVSHVRSLARPVDREVADDRRWEAME